MTSIRFIGDVPLWLGLVLSLVVGVLSWRYYRRESFNLPPRLKWLLPMLRASAFFLGIMILTGPVLHHRKTIGEPGRVKIYVDLSESMTMLDQHMPTIRKLRIAKELGWLNAEEIKTEKLDLAESLVQARLAFEQRLRAAEVSAESAPDKTLSVANESVMKAVRSFQEELTQLRKSLPNAINQELWGKLEAQFDSLTIEQESPEKLLQVTQNLLREVASIEQAIKKSFDDDLEQKLNAGDDSYRSAIAMFDESTRLRRAELALTGATAETVAALREEHEVELLMMHGSEAMSIQIDEFESVLNRDDHQGDLTDLSSAILTSQRTVQKTVGTSGSVGDAPVQKQTAVVLLTDGQHNSGPSPVQTAKILGGQGVKYFCVSFGSANQAEDLAVVGVEYPELVFKSDQVRGAVILRDSMTESVPFVVQIRNGDDVLWQKELVSQNRPERRVEFEFAINELVDQLDDSLDSSVVRHSIPLNLQAVIVPLAEEAETNNNQRSFRLAAIKQSYKLLILDGRSRWETRYLRNVFERDEQWDVTTVIAGPGTDAQTLPRGDQTDQFPTSREALFEFDLIILGEISPKLFQSHEFDWLKEFVEIRGGGMVLIDGQRGKLRELLETSLGSLVPVEWKPDATSLTPQSLELTERGAAESSLRLAVDDFQNRKFWTELPPPHTLVPVTALPGAEVLVEAKVGTDTEAAIVTRNYGAGRVLYFAFDETWRWRYKSADLWHQRIWNQLATYVMPRPYAVSDEFVSIDTGPVSYDFGESVDVRIRLRGVDGKPAVGSTADALFWKNGKIEATVALEADPDIPGIYRGRSQSLSTGEYSVSIRASGMSDSALKARSELIVEGLESGEMTATNANEELLSQMSAASAGVMLREEDVGRLPELLRPFSHGRILESETLIWQSYWWFAAMILLLTIEWVLRKRAGLL